MRRLRIASGLALALCLAFNVPTARAEHAAGEGGGHGEEHAACTAESSEAECLEYWEHHINWWSWDYKKPHSSPEHRHMPPPFGFALINFFIFAGILYRLAASPLRDFVRTRHTTIKKDIEEAAALHKEAEQRLAEYQQKIGAIDREIDTLLAQVRAEAEAEKARIMAAAQVQAERLKADAEVQIRNEIDRMRRDLKAEVVNAAVAAAQRVLADKASADDQIRLAERFVAEMEGPPASSAMRS